MGKRGRNEEERPRRRDEYKRGTINVEMTQERKKDPNDLV